MYKVMEVFVFHNVI